jgi:2',3'-cyclic-nucleotide 2'-phosphodiesterase (5'-nucleotidase family)
MKDAEYFEFFPSSTTLQNILGKSPEQESAPDKVVFHLDGFFAVETSAQIGVFFYDIGTWRLVYHECHMVFQDPAVIVQDIVSQASSMSFS